jgi:hypothetical protein
VKHLIIILLATLPLLTLSQQKNVILEDKPVPKPIAIDAKIDAWNKLQPGYSNLTANAKDFLYWVNYSRTNPKRFWDSVVTPILQTFTNLKSSYSESLKNDLYNQPQLPLLKLNPTLINTAQSHATDIGTHKGKPGHTSTDGRTFSDRLKVAGIKNCGGENVSIGNVDPILSLVLLYIDYGIPTLGHRKALLNPTYLETGIGVADYGDDGSLFIVQDFSCGQ